MTFESSPLLLLRGGANIHYVLLLCIENSHAMMHHLHVIVNVSSSQDHTT